MSLFFARTFLGGERGLKNYSSGNEPGCLLDFAASRTSPDDSCLLYKIVNYQKGGRLVEVYERGGEKEVERYAAEELKQFLQEDEGQMINQNVLKNSDDNVSVVIDEDENNFFVNRRFCWRKECKGLLGEGLLHVLIFCNSTKHDTIAKALLKVYPQLVNDIIEGQDYYGANALHLSIAFRNYDLASHLVECGVNIFQRATGRFFLPYDQQKVKPKKHSDFEGLFYMGEFPLAWAASQEEESTYNLLLKHGAHPDMQDSFGNTVLHIVVIQNKLSMYSYALRHPLKPARDGILNIYGLTPLTLACKLGRNQIFREMLELSAIEFWRYSNITCSAYPLSALDTITPEGRTNRNSATMIILNGESNEHLNMLDGEVIQRLVQEKWKTFARQQFLKRLFLMTVHLFLISVATYTRPVVGQPLTEYITPLDAVRFCAEIGVCISCASFVIFQEMKEIRTQGLWIFICSLSGNVAKAIFLLSGILIFLCIPCRIMGKRFIEDFLLSVAVTGSWIFLVFFAGAIRLTGTFITMIYKMIAGDVFRFSIIYIILLTGFTQAFWFISKNVDEDNELPKSYLEAWMSLFHYTLGVYEFSDFDDTVYPLLSKLLFTVFMILMPILLLNMLIAMMGNTYIKVIAQSEREWKRQWARIVLALELSVSQDQAKQYFESYSIDLAADGDESQKQRAVIVIKAKSKSKAKQRKGALANWKKIGNRLLSALKECGGKAEGVWAKFRSADPVCVVFPETRSATGGLLGDAISQLAFAYDFDFINTLNRSPSVEPCKIEPDTQKTELLVNDDKIPVSHESNQAMNNLKLIPKMSHLHLPDEDIKAEEDRATKVMESLPSLKSALEVSCVQYHHHLASSHSFLQQNIPQKHLFLPKNKRMKRKSSFSNSSTHNKDVTSSVKNGISAENQRIFPPYSYGLKSGCKKRHRKRVSKVKNSFFAYSNESSGPATEESDGNSTVQSSPVLITKSKRKKRLGFYQRTLRRNHVADGSRSVTNSLLRKKITLTLPKIEINRSKKRLNGDD